MDNSRIRYLLEVNDVLELVNGRSDLNESQKHFIVKKKLSLRQPNITVPKLGLIRFYKIFPGYTGGVNYYEIRDLKTVVEVDPFKIVDDGIDLNFVRMTDVTAELRLRKNLRKLDQESVNEVPCRNQWVTARFFDVIDPETLSVGFIFSKGEQFKTQLRIADLKDEFGNTIAHGISGLCNFVPNFERVDLIKVNLTGVDDVSGRWIGQVKILSRGASPVEIKKSRHYSFSDDDSTESDDFSDDPNCDNSMLE